MGRCFWDFGSGGGVGSKDNRTNDFRETSSGTVRDALATRSVPLELEAPSLPSRSDQWAGIEVVARPLIRWPFPLHADAGPPAGSVRNPGCNCKQGLARSNRTRPSQYMPQEERRFVSRAVAVLPEASDPPTHCPQRQAGTFKLAKWQALAILRLRQNNRLQATKYLQSISQVRSLHSLLSSAMISIIGVTTVMN